MSTITTEATSQELRIIKRGITFAFEADALQGTWSAEQYLRLTDGHSPQLEFTDGEIEVLPVPTKKHQAILRALFLLFYQWLTPRGGDVHFAGIRVYLREDKYREPDLIVLFDKRDPRGSERYWCGADLVVEVVSPDDPERDTITKVADYAEGGISEYWIVNPLEQTITVLRLDGASYATHGVFSADQLATSALLTEFSVEVAAIFAAE